MPLDLTQVNWNLVLPVTIPILTFIAGWWIGRRGNSSKGLYAIAKAIRDHGS